MKRIERETERARRGWWNNRLQLWHERESAACGGRCHIFFFFFFSYSRIARRLGKEAAAEAPKLGQSKNVSRLSSIWVNIPSGVFIYLSRGKERFCSVILQIFSRNFYECRSTLVWRKKGISKWKIFFYLDSLIKLPLDNLGEMNYTEFNRIEKKIIFLRSQQLYPNFLNPKI